MDVTPLIRQGQQIIQSYASGRFRISGQVHEGPVIVRPERAFSWEAPSDPAALAFEHFQPLLKEGRRDVCLLGMGKTMRFLDPALKKALKEAGLHVEVMDTGAACRTYNVLMAEERSVTAALLPAG